jgi:hypothetical protein
MLSAPRRRIAKHFVMMPIHALSLAHHVAAFSAS